MSDTEVEAEPVTKVARDLTEIVDLYQRLLSQAVRNGGHSMMPGGHAMVALGDVANMEAWENQQQATERTESRLEVFDAYRRAYTSVEDEDPDDAWSAFQLLEFWSEQWRREHNAEYGKKPTVASEANFLRYLLNWAWDNEPAWADFASDVKSARLKLENILTAGNRVERTRVLCDNEACDEPRRLIRLIDDDGRQDVWKCPTCKRRIDVDGFNRARTTMLRNEGAERYLLASEAVSVLRGQGRAERTIRRWLAPPVDYPRDRCTVCKRKWSPQEYAACPGIRDGEECGGELKPMIRVRSEAVIEGYCEVATHKTFLWWPDLWRRHITTRTTRRRAVA